MDASVITATFVVLLGFLLLMFVNFQAAIGPNSPLSVGWFRSTVANISNKYPTPVTPAGYAFGIWGLIYLWNFAWIVYVVTTLFRKNSRGPVYLNPPATSVMFLVTYFISMVANAIWLYLWDREFISQSTVALLLITLMLHLGLFISLTRVRLFISVFKNYADSDLWAYRVLVHNGFAIYAVWAMVATIVNLSVTLIYDADLQSDTATYVSLSILAVILVNFFVFDLFVLDSYTRYVFMVYPTFIWSLAGIMVTNQEDTDGPAFIYAAVLVSLSAAFFIVKTVFMSIRSPVYLTVKMANVRGTTYKYKRLN